MKVPALADECTTISYKMGVIEYAVDSDAMTEIFEQKLRTLLSAKFNHSTMEYAHLRISMDQWLGSFATSLGDYAVESQRYITLSCIDHVDNKRSAESISAENDKMVKTHRWMLGKVDNLARIPD